MAGALRSRAHSEKAHRSPSPFLPRAHSRAPAAAPLKERFSSALASLRAAGLELGRRHFHPSRGAPVKKIDIFPHIFPKAYFDKMVEVIPNKGAVRRWLNIPVLYDLDARLRMMEEFGPDYQQVLTL